MTVNTDPERPMTETPPALPTSMALAWGVTGQPTRGPKRALTLDQIVEAGRAIAVADGIGAVSMARVAERLGVSTMALYRYLPAKDDLLELMVDAALGRPPAAAADETWRDGLRRWAVGVRDSYRANPWALRVPITAPPLGPNNVRWLENALAALSGTKLDWQQKISCVLLISGFVRSEEMLLHEMLEAQQPDQPNDHYARTLAQLVDPQSFPQITAVIASGAMADEEGIDAEFEFGLERVLDGIGVLVAAARKRR
jgi:AcrR family transcriptional regulator